MGEYKIRHALAQWMHNGVARTAFRGQTAEIPEEEAKRLLAHNAIIPATEELKRPGVLQDLQQSPSDQELIAWLAAANGSEVADLMRDRPELRPRIDGALQNVTAAQNAESLHLEDLRRVVEGVAPLTAGDDDIHMNIPGDPSGDFDVLSGTTPPTGADLADTSSVGDDDIIFNPLNPAANFVEGGVDPSATNPDTIETNTPLEQPPVSLGTMDFNALVQGPADGVASYISTHPTEANAVLAAETKNTDGSPRAAIVLAARSAAGFNSAGS